MMFCLLKQRRRIPFEEQGEFFSSVAGWVIGTSYDALIKRAEIYDEKLAEELKRRDRPIEQGKYLLQTPGYVLLVDEEEE